MARPDDAPPQHPPRLRRILAEALAPMDVVRSLPALGAQLRRRRGAARDVIVLPGYLTTDRSTAVLRAALAHDGHRVRGWGPGRNLGDVPALAERVVALVDATHARSGQPVDLVGWSLGGMVAREAARLRPQQVRRILTMGTPLHGAGFTAFWRRYGEEELAASLQRTDRRVAPPVPVTIIWSKRDGVVQWRSQQDRDNPWAEHVEVRSTHLGMGIDPAVLAIIRERTAADVTTALRA